MKIHRDELRVAPGERVDLAARPTAIAPIYKTKAQYEALLRAHIAELSRLQELLYACNRHALLIIFQSMDAAGKDGAIKQEMSASIRTAVRSSASNIRAPRSLSTTSCGARRAAFPSAGGSASSTARTTRRY